MQNAAPKGKGKTKAKGKALGTNNRAGEAAGVTATLLSALLCSALYRPLNVRALAGGRQEKDTLDKSRRPRLSKAKRPLLSHVRNAEGFVQGSWKPRTPGCISHRFKRGRDFLELQPAQQFSPQHHQLLVC